MSRWTAEQARAGAGRRIDTLVSEAWADYVRERAAETRRAQRARQEEANRQQLLRILAAMRRRGWKTR